MSVSFKKRIFRISLLSFCCLGVFTTLVIVACNVAVAILGTPVYTSLGDVPAEKTALVLGTAPRVSPGRENAYFRGRIDAAAELYRTGKVKTLIVSGDNRHKDYNEPSEMKRALIAMGVPAKAIVCDFAGLRTLDPVVRIDKIFGQKSFVIVSQDFHCARAVFLANSHGLKACGFAAPAEVNRKTKLRNWGRERLARVLAVADIAFNREPQHLGNPEPVE